VHVAQKFTLYRLNLRTKMGRTLPAQMGGTPKRGTERGYGTLFPTSALSGWGEGGVRSHVKACRVC